jgi:Acyclic terpene utilisation family protein AtuA
VYVCNGSGRARTDSYKVSIGYQAGFRGEGEISYAGQNALARAELAGRVISERLGEDFPDLRIDYIGSTSVHRKSFASHIEPYEIRLRVAALASSAKHAERIGEEVEALYTNGPAGGGAARKYVTEVIGIVSALLSRSEVSSKVTVLESEPHHEIV